MAAIVGPGAPYVSPAVLLNSPTGIDWESIPDFGSSDAQQYTEALNLCQRASAAIDAYCQTALRATINTETVYGPGDTRCASLPDGTMRLMMSRPPVVSVIGGTVAPRASFPIGSGATTIPANMMAPEKPVTGIYGTNSPGPVGESGQAIIVAPGYGSWANGRMGLKFSITYMNGYPHCSITEDYPAGTSAIHVDDITGMVGHNTGQVAEGAFCTFYAADDAVQESNSVLSVSPDTDGAISGPGTLTLAYPTSYPHSSGELFSSLPATVQQACILMATSMALVRGGTSTSIQSINPSVVGSGQSDMSPSGLKSEAECLVAPYRRVW